MKRYQWICFGLIVVSTTSGNRLQADSIWERRDPRHAYLFMDNRARRVGDILLVVVNESTDATNKEQRKMTKDTAASGKFNFAGKASAVSSKSASANLSSDQSTDRSFQGSAEYESNRQLLDGLSVVVVDIMPNGNLVIEGTRRRVVSNETRWLRITGLVRPNDIEIPNKINSTNIANFSMVYEGGGVESRFTNQGWMGRITNKIWPF